MDIRLELLVVKSIDLVHTINNDGHILEKTEKYSKPLVSLESTMAGCSSSHRHIAVKLLACSGGGL